jgi:hypothetical protein
VSNGMEDHGVPEEPWERVGVAERLYHENKQLRAMLEEHKMTFRNGVNELPNGSKSYGLTDLPPKGMIVWATSHDLATKVEHLENGVCVQRDENGQVIQVGVWHPTKLYRIYEDALLALMSTHGLILDNMRTEIEGVEKAEQGYQYTLMSLYLRAEKERMCGTTNQTEAAGGTAAGTDSPAPTT